MSATYLGGMTVGGACAGAEAGIALAATDLQAKISALLAFNPQPVSLTAQLELAQAALASINAAIAIGLPMPDISAQIAIVLAQLGILQSQLAALAALQAAFAVGGLHVYAAHSDAINLAADFGTLIPADGHLVGATDALLIATNRPEAWVALGAILSTG